MGRYFEIKAQMDALAAELEQAKAAEINEQIADIKQRIAAFGLTPHQLFDEPARHRRNPNPLSRGPHKPAKYKWGTRSWSGEGSRPQWFREALRSGVTEAQMLIDQGEPK